MARERPVLRLTAADGTLVADHVLAATSPWRRFKGLMGVRALLPGHGLALTPCGSIHMFFMRIPLDVAFLDRSGKVLKIHAAIRPWRMTLPVRRAHTAVELPAGTLAASGVVAGDVLTLA